MAGGGFTANGGTSEYPGKMTAYVIFACVISASGGLIFGYDIGISGKNLILEHGFHFFLSEIMTVVILCREQFRFISK